MEETAIFSSALGLSHPWKVGRVEFKQSEGSMVSELHLYIEYGRPHKFDVEGSACSVYDHVDKTWRHLNFFQHQCYLHASVPRVRTEAGNTVQIEVPWARAGSGFTLLFEAFSLVLIKSGLSMTAAGKLLGVDGKLVGRIIRHYVDKALLEQPLEQVEKLGIDETSIAKGHKYMTVATDMERKKVVGISQGKDMFAFTVALGDMLERGSQPGGIKAVAMDMSQAYTAAALEFLPDAEIVYDRFHLEQVLSKALDEIRKIEQQESHLLRKTKYIWLRNESTLTTEQSQQIHYLSQTFPALGQAYRLKEQFKEIWKNTTKEAALEDFNSWMKLAEATQINQMKKVVNTFRSHLSGIITHFEHRLTSGFVERVNLTIQEIKRTAKGFRNFENFRAIIFLKLGKLDLLTHSM